MDEQAIPNPYHSGEPGAVSLTCMSLLHVGSQLVAHRHSRSATAETTWRLVATMTSALCWKERLSPENANRAVAFECAQAIHEWVTGYAMSLNDDSPPPTSSIEAYLAHAIAGRYSEAVLVLDWSDQLPQAKEMTAAIVRPPTMGTEDFESWQRAKPRQAALVSALVLAMDITANTLGDIEGGSHRGHGCPHDPDRES